MKTIGLLGGMSWESTVTYYQMINRGINRELGGLHSARILLASVDFEQIEQLQQQNNWPEAARILTNTANKLDAAGAEFIVICTNTMHKVAPEIASGISIPLLHIADATAARLHQAGILKVGLLGTRFTMQEDFYRGRIEVGHGIEVLVPQPDAQLRIHEIIYKELCLGQINSESRKVFVEAIEDLDSRGAEAVILGCTEIGLLVHQQHTSTRLFDTTEIHADEAVKLALQ